MVNAAVKGTSNSCNSMQYYNKTSGCICKNGLTGSQCDRNRTLCHKPNCQNKTLCSSFIHSSVRCISTQYQFSFVQNSSNIRYPLLNNYTQSIEENIQTLYEKKTQNNTTSHTSTETTKITTPEKVVIEILSTHRAGDYVYFTLYASKGLSTYTNIPATELCTELSSSAYKCSTQTDCDNISKYGVDCMVVITPATTTPAPKKEVEVLTGGVIAIIAALCIVVVILIVAYIFMKIQKKRKLRRSYFTSEDCREPIPLPNMFQVTTDMSKYNKYANNHSLTDGKSTAIADWVSHVDTSAAGNIDEDEVSNSGIQNESTSDGATLNVDINNDVNNVVKNDKQTDINDDVFKADVSSPIKEVSENDDEKNDCDKSEYEKEDHKDESDLKSQKADDKNDGELNISAPLQLDQNLDNEKHRGETVDDSKKDSSASDSSDNDDPLTSTNENYVENIPQNENEQMESEKVSKDQIASDSSSNIDESIPPKDELYSLREKPSGENDTSAKDQTDPKSSSSDDELIFSNEDTVEDATTQDDSPRDNKNKTSANDQSDSDQSNKHVSVEKSVPVQDDQKTDSINKDDPDGNTTNLNDSTNADKNAVNPTENSIGNENPDLSNSDNSSNIIFI